MTLKLEPLEPSAHSWVAADSPTPWPFIVGKVANGDGILLLEV